MNRINYINKYNKNNYKQLCLMLKPEEKCKLDKVLKKYNMSLRKYLISKIEDERVD